MNPFAERRDVLTALSRKEPKPSTVRKDEAKVEAWAEVGHDRRTSLKAKSQQRKGTALFRAHYDQIEWKDAE